MGQHLSSHGRLSASVLPLGLTALLRFAAMLPRHLRTLAAPTGPQGEPCWAQVGQFAVTTGVWDQSPTLFLPRQFIFSCQLHCLEGQAQPSLSGLSWGRLGQRPSWAWGCFCFKQ